MAVYRVDGSLGFYKSKVVLLIRETVGYDWHTTNYAGSRMFR